jgi:biotin synthase-like enzyme
MAVDASRPFPLIRNKTLNIAALLSKKNTKSEKQELDFATVQVPGVLPRLVQIPSEEENAKEIGLDVCSGGIIGLGETWQDRIEMAFTLKELGVESIPINILTPIKGTPMGNRELLAIDEILKTIAIYRIINKDKNIRIAAGREGRMKDFMGMAFMSGANGMLVGGYLTTKGRSWEDDKKFIDDMKKLWEE